jgi:hypothetical protein
MRLMAESPRLAWLNMRLVAWLILMPADAYAGQLAPSAFQRHHTGMRFFTRIAAPPANAYHDIGDTIGMFYTALIWSALFG